MTELRYNIPGHTTKGIVRNQYFYEVQCECGTQHCRPLHDPTMWDDLTALMANHQKRVLADPLRFARTPKEEINVMEPGEYQPLLGAKPNFVAFDEGQPLLSRQNQPTKKPVDTSPRTVVELIDSTPGNVCHKVKTVHINGKPVRIKADSLQIDYGYDDVTTVTVTLMVDELHFRHRREDEEHV